MKTSKKIGSFKEFLNEQKKQKQQKINEANLEIQVDFWDTAQNDVIEDLKTQCNGDLNYDNIIRYVKAKFQVLGREIGNDDLVLLLQHIKDLIFQHYGDSLLYTNGDWDWTEEGNAEIQAKGLVVGELAKVILDKVLTSTSTTISLIDKENVVSDDEYDDLPYESRKVRPVKKFNEYTKMLEETVTILDCSCKDECIDYCMNRVKEEVGSYDPDAILIKAAQTADPRVKARLVLLYVKDMVLEYITKEKVQVGMVDVNGKKGEAVPEDVLEQGLDCLSHDIADEVLQKIANENGVCYAEVE